MIYHKAMLQYKALKIPYCVCPSIQLLCVTCQDFFLLFLVTSPTTEMLK